MSRSQVYYTGDMWCFMKLFSSFAIQVSGNFLILVTNLRMYKYYPDAAYP